MKETGWKSDETVNFNPPLFWELSKIKLIKKILSNINLRRVRGGMSEKVMKNKWSHVHQATTKNSTRVSSWRFSFHYHKISFICIFKLKIIINYPYHLWQTLFAMYYIKASLYFPWLRFPAICDPPTFIPWKTLELSTLNFPKSQQNSDGDGISTEHCKYFN